MDEENTANIDNRVAARREARKKKILENSRNRLVKITGREEDVGDNDSSTSVTTPSQIVYPDPDFERDTYEPESLNLFDAPPEFNQSDIYEIFNSLKTPDQNGNIPNINRLNQQHPPPAESLLLKFLKTKVHIMLMAIVIYILFATNNNIYVGNNIFLVLLTWEMVEVFLFKTYENKNNFINIILLLGGISNKYSHIIIKVAETLNKIMKDVAIFAFFFVLTHLFWNYFILDSNLNNILNVDTDMDDLILDEWHK